jgi:hypothetical protein
VGPADPAALARLPHGEEARLLTAAWSEPGSGTARGVREPALPDARANGAGYLPQSLLVEMMGQTAGLALPSGSGGALVARIERLHLHRAARGGERVEVEARLVRQVGRVFVFRCRAESSGLLLAHGSIALRAL